MVRHVFHSFHYQPDNWRAQQIRNIGAVEGNVPAHPNNWEEIKRQGDAAIQRWIDEQMGGRSCVIVLIGSATANRKWINYEITKGWNDGKGVFGIYIHHLKDSNQNQTYKGKNPFDYIVFSDGRVMSSVVSTYDPPYKRSDSCYNHIRENMEEWVETALRQRGRS